MVAPTHTGVLLPAAGAPGIPLTVTAVVPALLVHPETVAVTEYVPAPAAVMPAMLGFCDDDVKPFGPVQLYVAPDTVDAKRFNVDPAHTGPLLVAVGAEGIAFTVAATVPAVLVHPETVTVTEYVPVAAVVAPEMLGSSNEDENPFGPVHE